MAMRSTPPAAGTNSGTRAGGLGFFGALTIAFIVLKLCGVIGWSWWLVLAPVWSVAVLVVVLAAVGVAIVWVLGSLDQRDKARRREAAKRRRAGMPLPYEHGPRHHWGAMPKPVYGFCPTHNTRHEMLAHGGRMCDGWSAEDGVNRARP